MGELSGKEDTVVVLYGPKLDIDGGSQISHEYISADRRDE